VATATVAAKSRTAITAITARATRTTRATGTTRAAGTTGAAGATPRGPTTTALTAEITRRRRQLPADPSPRHLATTWPVIVLRLAFRPAEHEASKAAWLVAAITPGATEAAAATAAAATATATATATAATISAAATVAALAIVATPALRRRDAIDGVVVLAAGDRSVRTLLALKHAHEAHLVQPGSNNIKRFDQASRTVGLDAQRARHRIDDRIGLLLDRRVGYGRIGSRNRASLGACLGITRRYV
jgi:hypothetical protein